MSILKLSSRPKNSHLNHLTVQKLILISKIHILSIVENYDKQAIIDYYVKISINKY